MIDTGKYPLELDHMHLPPTFVNLSRGDRSAVCYAWTIDFSTVISSLYEFIYILHVYNSTNAQWKEWKVLGTCSNRKISNDIVVCCGSTQSGATKTVFLSVFSYLELLIIATVHSQAA